jgi:hypothetical protein
LLVELLSLAPFDQLRSPVLWLKADERGQWAQCVVAVAAPLVSNKVSAG